MKPPSQDVAEKEKRIRRVNRWQDLPLWNHQRQAIELVGRYLQEKTDDAMIIQLPTGTGKTGIMAVIAACRREKSHVLIVCPWKQLARQLKEEVAGGFWAKLKARPRHEAGNVDVFTPSTLRPLLGPSRQSRVLICTYQTLTAVMRRRPLAELMRQRIGLVLADEGHREPAPKWSLAVRALTRPTVLFTATPYRNDFRTFRVSDDHAIQLSYDQAVAGRYVREVKFHPESYEGDLPRFCALFADFFQKKLPGLKPSAVSSPRAIVRCGSEQAVVQVAKELRKHLGQDNVLAIHERMPRPRGPLDRTDVPKPGDQPAKVWVHQNKLIEGVDDPDFCCLAFFEPFGDDRSLVQQIGRVVRNPRRLHLQVAHVFADAGFGLEEHWRSYRDYDRKNPQPWRDVENYNRIVAEHVATLYVGKQFREIFDPQSEDFYKDLRYHRSARLFRLRDQVDLDWYSNRLDRALVERGCQVLKRATPDADTVVMIYQDLHPSRHLLEKAFPEARLGYVVTRILHPYLVHYDTSIILPEFFPDIASPIEAEALESIINHSEATVTQVSLLNGDLGMLAARRRSMAVVSLSDMPPALNDAMFAVSTVTAYRTLDVPAPINAPPRKGDGLRSRWYVGFENATVTQTTPRHFTYADFIAWTDWLVDLLQARGKNPDGSLNRFARYVGAPKHPRATHVLFDTAHVETLYTPLPVPDGTQPAFDHLCIEDRASQVADGKFSVIANGQTVTGRIKWDGAAFQLDCPELAKSYLAENRGGRRRADFISRVNHEQAFRVITDNGMLYAHGRFALPRSSLWGRDCPAQSRISRVIEPVDALNGTTGEKDGAAARRNGWWDRDSVFSRIDEGDLFAAAGFQPEVLVCEDMGNESADFIALSLTPPRRLVLIHAKYAKGRNGRPPPRLSAAAFHVICGQVQKNLSFFVPDGSLHQGKRWNDAWKGGDAYSVPRRIRRSPPGFDGERIAAEIGTLVRSTDTLKEVWIVSGAGLCATRLIQEESKAKPRAEAMQLIYLLHGTWNLVSMWGAKLKVFCPAKPPP